MGFFSRFSKPDPKKMEENKKIKFKEFETMFGGNKEFENNTKATWLVDRGIYYEKKGMFEEGLEDFNEAIALKPDHLPAHYSKAKLFKRKGETERAKKVLEDMPEEMKLDGRIVATKKAVLDQYGF